MTELLLDYGLALVFVNVLVEQLGLPIPAMPMLVIAGAAAADGQLSASGTFAVAFLAATLGDVAWYLAGRRYGSRIMRLVTRLSPARDFCACSSEHRFQRGGGLALVLAKFVPGACMVVRPLAGAMGMSGWTFAIFNSVGTAIWVGAAISIGVLCHHQLDRWLIVLPGVGAIALVVLAVLRVAHVVAKAWERRRASRRLLVARINADERQHVLERCDQPIVVDLRSAANRETRFATTT